MPSVSDCTTDKSRLAVLLTHFATIEDPRDVRRILHPLAEVLLLVVCATIADCETMIISPPGVRRIWTSCAATCPMNTAFPAAAG